MLMVLRNLGHSKGSGFSVWSTVWKAKDVIRAAEQGRSEAVPNREEDSVKNARSRGAWVA